MVGKKGLRAVPLPTEAELEVLQVLWVRGASTVREVFELLSGTKDVGYTTVLKQMQVMFEKGLLERSERFRSHVYTAQAAREETQQRLAGNLLERAFAGKAPSVTKARRTGHIRELDTRRARGRLPHNMRHYGLRRL